MNAPDRIWARPIGATVDWTGSTSGPWALDDPHNTATAFIASTPAREHAEELVGMVGDLYRVASSSSYNHAKDDTLARARALLSKIDTGENNDQG